VNDEANAHDYTKRHWGPSHQGILVFQEMIGELPHGKV
jgi:hypothetical protein